jgi:capsular polysaccharide biosynthesis protein
LSTSELQSRVAVTPLVNNPIIRVTGKGSDAADARKVTTAVTSGIITAVNRQNAEGTQGTALLARFRAATTARLEAEAKLKRLRRRRSTSDAALQRAQTELSAARLAADTSGTLYSTVQSADTGASNVERLQPATDAGNDRKSKVEQLGFVGVVAGLVVGMAFALLRESRRRRRLA